MRVGFHRADRERQRCFGWWIGRLGYTSNPWVATRHTGERFTRMSRTMVWSSRKPKVLETGRVLVDVRRFKRFWFSVRRKSNGEVWIDFCVKGIKPL